MTFRNPVSALAGVALALLICPSSAQAQRDDAPPPPRPVSAQDKLVYADFEQKGPAVSARGGSVSLVKYQESDLQQTTVKGAPDGNTPDVVRIKPDDPNHLAKVDFSIKAPNQFAGAGIEIKGQPDADGKTPFDDVTGYKKLTLQLYAKGAETVRVELISRGYGVDLPAGYPQRLIKVQPGLNTYEIALKALAQPTWVEIKQDPKKILAKLTAISITVVCDQCHPMDGMLIVDNVSFER